MKLMPRPGTSMVTREHLRMNNIPVQTLSIFIPMVDMRKVRVNEKRNVSFFKV